MRHFNVTTVTDNLCRFSPIGDEDAYCVESKMLETRAHLISAILTDVLMLPLEGDTFIGWMGSGARAAY
jgi:hypothetical protein